MSIGIKFKGLGGLKRTLIKKAAKIDEVDRKLGQGAFKVERDAKINAPVDTSALRNSIFSSKIKDLQWKVADGVRYGKYQEFGVPSRNLPGKHFMQKAFKKNIKKIIASVKNVYD